MVCTADYFRTIHNPRKNPGLEGGAGGTKIIQSSITYIQIDANELNLLLHPKSRTQLTLHFDSPFRRFYLSVIVLVVNEIFIPFVKHFSLDPFGAAKPVLLERGKEAPLRVNPEQAQVLCAGESKG